MKTWIHVETENSMIPLPPTNQLPNFTVMSAGTSYSSSHPSTTLPSILWFNGITVILQKRRSQVRNLSPPRMLTFNRRYYDKEESTAKTMVLPPFSILSQTLIQEVNSRSVT
ncbi:unnamed protein product [Cuscuta epithymum]|uniref:Uncharacterized protein n=1 Tax=Cuscuta epithymum TaxID=186058 RepID=A0AAV0E7Q6_9ASTE|nr:unnamed protein product [Cuscuta epithymum]